MAPEANDIFGINAAQCQIILKRSKCDLRECRKQCFLQKKGFGVCVANVANTDYACVCNYKCNSS